MLVDIDSNGNISITEITPPVALALQSAILHIIETNKREHDSALRHIAIRVDQLLPKSLQE